MPLLTVRWSHRLLLTVRWFRRLLLTARWSRRLLFVAFVLFLFTFMHSLHKNKWANARLTFVKAHNLVRINIIGGDLSENALYSHVLPTAGYRDHLQEGIKGCVWDVGANDGVWHSNSHYLINERGYNAWLFEPDAETFLTLRSMYASASNNPTTVNLFNIGMSDETSLAKLRTFPMGHENTIIKSKNNQYDEMVFEYSIGVFHSKLLCEQQKQAKKQGICDYSVLSVDVEGADGKVIYAAHKAGCTWDLLIAETPHSIPSQYYFVLKSGYNHIYALKN